MMMLASSMLIFGTIGIFRRYIPLSSGLLAFARGLIGTLFLCAVMWLRKMRSFSAERGRGERFGKSRFRQRTAADIGEHSGTPHHLRRFDRCELDPFV